MAGRLMAVTVRILKDQQIEAFRDQIVQVRQDAFGVPPYSKQETERLDLDLERGDF